MQEAWRAYLELALGVTQASRKKAEQVVRGLVGKGGATAAQMQGFAEDLLATSRANREGLARLVRYEVDRALGTLGLATREEVTDLTGRVADLERELRQQRAATEPAGASGAAAPAAKRTVAKKAVAKKAVAPRPPAKKAVAKKAATRKAPARKAGAGTQPEMPS